MANETKDRQVNTAEPVKNDGAKRLPHERDEAPDMQNIKPREDMKQAADDLAHGLIDTDLHGIRGVEKVVQADDKVRPKPKGKPK